MRIRQLTIYQINNVRRTLIEEKNDGIEQRGWMVNEHVLSLRWEKVIDKEWRELVRGEKRRGRRHGAISRVAIHRLVNS